MRLDQVGVVPKRTADPQEALRLVKQAGAAILTGLGREAEDGRQAAMAVFGDKLLAVPPAAIVNEGGDKDRRPMGLTYETRSKCHSDGYAYGDKYPDYILLLCNKHSEEGGESFLVDGYKMLEVMAEDPEVGWIPQALNTVRINQTEAGMQPSTSTIVKTSPMGRKMLLMANEIDQRPRDDSTDPVRDQEMLVKWRETIYEATDHIPHFKLYPGEAYVVDNYRLFHGREAYTDIDRNMWRVWVWTEDSAFGLPDGLLHSDSRNARVNVA